MTTLFDAVTQFINLIIPITQDVGWWDNTRLIIILTLTLLLLWIFFVLPLIRFICWGIFGDSKKSLINRVINNKK